MIRERAGLEGVQASWTKYSISPSKAATKEGLREIIQHEREIELVLRDNISGISDAGREFRILMNSQKDGMSFREILKISSTQ